jgi:hypothetical protein
MSGFLVRSVSQPAAVAGHAMNEMGDSQAMVTRLASVGKSRHKVASTEIRHLTSWSWNKTRLGVSTCTGDSTIVALTAAVE